MATVTLELNSEDAGDLFDLLYSHIAGYLTTSGHSLHNVLTVLQKAGVERRPIYMLNNGNWPYPRFYTTEEEARQHSSLLGGYNGYSRRYH